MKNIEIEEDLYQYIASKTKFIGESATSILRRLLLTDGQELLSSDLSNNQTTQLKESSSTINEEDSQPTPLVESPISETADLTSEVNTVDGAEESHECVFNYLNKEELAMQRGAVGRFLLILGALHRVHANKFSVVSEIRGRDRLYFSDNLNELTESGSSTKPFQIPESPYWVVTNSNTTRKKMILTKVAIALGYSEEESADIRELL